MTAPTLRRARPDEAGVLTEPALAAKACWGYGEDFIESCRTEMTFRPDAEVCYLWMGAERIGQTPSGSIPGRMLPRLRAGVSACAR